jgi:hypothetical protein
LHAVVQARRHAVEAEEGVLDKLWGGPLAGREGVAGFDVSVHC